MNVRPLCLQTFRMPRDQSLSALHVTVGNRSNDLGDCTRPEIDPHDRAGLRDALAPPSFAKNGTPTSAPIDPMRIRPPRRRSESFAPKWWVMSRCAIVLSRKVA